MFVEVHIILLVLFQCVVHGLILNLIAMIYLYVRIDKKKKILVTTFLTSIGIARDEIISLFYNFDQLYTEKGEFYQKVDEQFIGQRIEKGMLPEKDENAFIGKRITKEIIATA